MKYIEYINILWIMYLKWLPIFPIPMNKMIYQLQLSEKIFTDFFYYGE